MKKIVGFNLIYPEGCKEITEGLKSDELRRRMTDLIRVLEDTQIDKPFSTDSLLNNTDANISVKEELKMEGLLLHLTSEMFIDHEEVDIQLRVAVCICNILKLYCPTNPFLVFSDSKTRLKTVLDFLLKCLNEMAKLKSKSDKHFLNLYKIFSISCETHLFHSFTLADDGESLFIEYVRTMYNIVRKFPDWSDDIKPFQTLSDAMIVLFSSHEISVPDKVVSYMLNFLADRAATKEQRQLSLDIIGRCLSKMEDQMQTIIRNHLIKSEIDDDVSESSDNQESEREDDDFCSMPEFKIASKKQEQKLEKSKPKPQKLEKNKNTIETCVEYSCDHTFQLVYELFKINAAIVIPLLSTIEMKLRSPNNVTDRKRACRLLGKLFISYIPSNNSSHSTLWECFLGRFCDIEVEVREICVRVARDVLRRAITGDDISGILSIPTSKEDLVRALQKRSHDQEESIRFQLVLSISQIFEKSKSIIVDEELDFVNETLFKILVDRTRDKCMIVRKEANASLGKLYRRILSESELRVGECNRNLDTILDLGNLLPGQRARLELLLTQILRLYLRTEVEDKIVVERLFNTFLVPYNFDSGNRMKALLQCFILCDETSIMSIQELFKTQVIIMNLLRETVHLIKDSNTEKVLSPSVSQKLKDKVKRLGEYLPNKDKIESLSKFFVSIRTDKKLMDIVSKLVNQDSSRDVIVKSIPEIKKHFSTTKPGTDANPANLQKKKVLVNTIKCLLERSAPIIMDISSGQELISLLVSSKEALESFVHNEEYTAYICRALKLLHCISIIYRNSVPTLEAYEFIASIISRFDSRKSDSHIETLRNEINDDKQLTPSSTKSIASMMSTQSTFKELPKSIEELCLLTLARIIDCRPSSESIIDTDEDKFSAFHDQCKTLGLFSEEAEPLLTQTVQVIDYLMNCSTVGSTFTMLLFGSGQCPNKTNHNDQKNLPVQYDDGDREFCLWKYNCKIAKLATRCLICLYVCCQQESRLKSSEHKSEILEMLENKLEDLVKSVDTCELFSTTQSIRLSTLSQLGLKLKQRYGADIHSYVQNTVLMRMLTSEDPESATELTEPRNLSSWGSNNSISTKTQVIILALKMLSKWMVTLKVDDDRNLILTVMIALRKYIGSNSNPNFIGNIMDGDMAQIRLAAGKCWLKLAQVQSFLSIFDVKWLHRLSELIYDPCSNVREGFLRKLHKGLFRLQLPLDYMAMFAFVPFIQSSEYMTMAKNFFAANVTRRREFLERNPQYQTDAKLLFAVLPEYVLAFIIHMLAHDKHWLDVDDQASIFRVKQCLWFVMEPILKMNENSSFIRKLLEKIKHAQDATDPNNSIINEKLYICCDISLGLLISKQASYDLKEYPVELKLPRTRYLPAPNTFFNPDFANILIGEDPPKVRVQFSPTHKSKQMMMNFMPAPLIKGHVIHPAITNSKASEESDIQIQKPIAQSKPKKHIAKIVVGFPEIESEAVSSPPSLSSNVQETTPKRLVNVRKMPVKRKIIRTESPIDEVEELEANPMMSVTKRGRICKPNVRVMKDMVSLTKKSATPSSTPSANENNDLSDSTVRIEGTVSINLERMETYDYTSDNFDEEETPKKSEIVIANEGKSSKVQKSISTKAIESSSLSLDKTINRRPSILKKPIGNERNSRRSVSASKEIDESENVKIIPLKRAAGVIKPTKKVVIVHSPEILDNKIDIAPDNNNGKKNSPSSNRKSKNFKDKTNIKMSKETRNLSSISSPFSVVRVTRSSQEKTPTKSPDSVTLNRLTKEILTRKASSIRSGKVKDVSENVLKNINNKSNTSSIVLDMEKSSKKVTRNKSVLNNTVASSNKIINSSPSLSPTRKTPVKTKKPIESSPRTPITIVSRSKRVASQAATDSLIKKTKVI